MQKNAPTLRNQSRVSGEREQSFGHQHALMFSFQLSLLREMQAFTKISIAKHKFQSLRTIHVSSEQNNEPWPLPLLLRIPVWRVILCQTNIQSLIEVLKYWASRKAALHPKYSCNVTKIQPKSLSRSQETGRTVRALASREDTESLTASSWYHCSNKSSSQWDGFHNSSGGKREWNWQQREMNGVIDPFICI